MNHKRKLFISEYVTTGNAAMSAIYAGYSPKTARSTGARLLTFVDIAEAIQAAQNKVADESLITVKEIVKEIKALSLSTKSEVVKLKAFDLLMKHLGGYVNELAIIQKMNDADLQKLAEVMIKKMN